MRHYQTCLATLLTLSLGLTAWAADPTAPAPKPSAKAAAVNTSTSPTTAKPTFPVDFSTPEKTFETYLKALQGFHYDILKDSVTITDPDKTRLVEGSLNFTLWQNYLERECLAKFGPEEGLTVISHARSYDDQIKIDLKRLPLSNIDIDPVTRTKATLYLKPEKNPLPDVKTDDTFYFKKVDGNWKIDYIKTYQLESSDPDRQQALKLNESLYPKMAQSMRTLADQVKAGAYKSAPDVKDALDKAWETATPTPKDD